MSYFVLPNLLVTIQMSDFGGLITPVLVKGCFFLLSITHIFCFCSKKDTHYKIGLNTTPKYCIRRGLMDCNIIKSVSHG